MKLLVVSDIHLHNWNNWNSSWNGDIPSRLDAYLHLAESLLPLGKNRGTEATIVAGDLLHSPLVRPMVHNTALEFMRILSRHVPTYIISGNHDTDSRSESGDYRRHTIVDIVSHVRNVHYVHDAVIPFDKTSVYFLGWEPVPRPVDRLKDADIFVSHGLVAGAKNSVGYGFMSGFNAQELSKKYSFSVVGDIHRGQMLFGNVLIPGTPIQHSFGDSPDTGVWVLDTLTYQAEFVPITDPAFPKFLTVDELPAETKENTYYKVRLKPTQMSAVQTDMRNIAADNLKDLTKAVVGELKLSNADQVLALSNDLLDKLPATITGKTLPNAAIRGVEIKNFGSTKYLKLDFAEPSKILVLGKVGSGKSTVLKAICFGLYGKSTEMKSNDQITPVTYKAEDGTAVMVEVEVNGQLYRIVRYFGHPAHGNDLTLFQVKGDQTVEIKKSSMRDTQQFINELIGLDYDDFTTLCYYSQKKSSFFGTMSPAYQSGLLMKFMGDLEERLALLTKETKAKITDLDSEVSRLIGSHTTLTNQVDGFKRRVESLSKTKTGEKEVLDLIRRHNIAGDPATVASALLSGKVRSEQRDAYLALFKTDWQTLKKETDEIQQTLNVTQQLKTQISSEIQITDSEIRESDREMKTLATEVTALRENKCHACQRPFDKPLDNTRMKSLIDKIDERVKTVNEKTTKQKERRESLTTLDENYKGNRKEYERLTGLGSSVEAFLKLAEDLSKDQSAEIPPLMQMIETNTTEAGTVKKQIEEKRILLDVYKVIDTRVFSNKGVYARALEGVGVILSDYMNRLLQNANSKIRVHIETVTYNKSGTPSSKLEITTDFGGGKVLPYTSLSGGQGMLIDVLSIVGFYNVLSDKYRLMGGVLGFLSLDEIVNYVDESYVDVIKSVLDEVKSRVTILISHNPDMTRMFDKHIQVSIVNDVSEYDLSGIQP